MSDTQTPLSIESFEGEKTGRYIVLLKEDSVQADVFSGIASINSFDSNTAVTHQWDAVNGFAGNFDEGTLSALQNSPGIAAIVEDGIVHTKVSSPGQPWGLGRISSDKRLVGQDKDLVYTYNYDPRAGQGVDVYVVDTGVRVTHEEFGGRATWAGVFGGYPEADGNGHGTHCAATVAGTKYGVAKLANIRAIKVLSDSGSGAISDVISGMNLALNLSRTSGRPSVVSMSLGGPPNSALDAVARKLIKEGVHVIVAAGNENADASTSSPARVAEVTTVGASTILDERAYFSNYGPLVDIFAPGLNITSAWIDSDNATKTISGTSMATPHVAGFTAYLISIYGNAAPYILSHAIKDIATKGALLPSTLPPGTSNALLSNTAST